MAGRKRPAERELGGRVPKLLRELVGCSSVTDGRVFGSPSLREAGGVPDARIWKGSGRHFYQASPSAVAAFDWSSLTAALDEEGFPDTRRHAEEGDDVFVLGTVWPVPLTKRCILREILRRLDLVVHGFGIMLDDIGLNIGWIDVDVPPSEVGGVRGRKKFYSEECTTRVEAMENACEAAVAWMIRVCHVEVRDLNFEKMKDLEGKARHMDQLVSMFCDAAEASKENQQATKRYYRALFMQAQCLLKKYSDVVPADRGPSVYSHGAVGVCACHSDNKGSCHV